MLLFLIISLHEEETLVPYLHAGAYALAILAGERLNPSEGIV